MPLLTNLNFLNIGQPWPPKCEVERLDRYRDNKLLFENQHAEVYKQAFKRIERVIGNFQEVVSYPVIANFQKLLSLKVADLLLGEEPSILAKEPEGAAQKAIDKIKENSDLWNTCYMLAIDVSRYGDGLFNIMKDEETKIAYIGITQPPIWFPIVSPDDIKILTNHVLAWTYEVGEGDSKKTHLKVRVHHKGKYEESEYLLESSIALGKGLGKTIKSVVSPPTTKNTGLTGFAVVQVPNVITSDRVTGMDDYDDIDSIVSELLVRVAQIERVLDQHTKPSISGPSSSLQQDPKDGEWKLKMGNFFPRDTKEDAPVEYIVWDANMDANFKIIDKLINFLYTLSEMGPALLGDMENVGNVSSGTALRFRMISPLAKVKRVAMRFRPALIEAIKLCSELKGEGVVDLRKESITVTFQDGLPGDPMEDATS